MLFYDRIDVSEGIDIDEKVHEKVMIFVTIGIFYIWSLTFNRMSAMGVMMY